MRSLLLTALILIATPLAADITSVYCGACRDVYAHPQDFGNFGYNLVFGDSPVLTLSEGNQMKVLNGSGQWAIVDLDFVIENYSLTFSIGFLTYSFAAPTGAIRIAVQDPAGRMTTYEVFASSSDLIVGDGGTQQQDSTSTTPTTTDTDISEIPTLDSSAGGGFGWIAGPYYWYMGQPFYFQTDNLE